MTKNLKLYHENKLIPTSLPSVLVWKAWLEMEIFHLGFFYLFNLLSVYFFSISVEK